MTTGKRIRLENIFRRQTGNSVVVALDHGGIAGPVKGIEHPALVVKQCIEGGADAILTTRGVITATEGEWRRETSIIMRITGGFTVLGGLFEEELISSPQAALRLGASAVVVTVKIGTSREGESIKQASLVADECEKWGLPIMVEAIAKNKDMRPTDPAGVKLAARAAQEIGADIIKTYYTGDPQTFSEVVEGCPVPVLILGGEKTDNLENVFRDVHDAIKAGSRGIAMGRNIWQQRDTRAMVEAMVGIVHKGWTVSEAMKHTGL